MLLICYSNKLTSLVGCLQKINGDFDCHWNDLTTLYGAPQTVGGNFDCRFNPLASLVGLPNEICGDFICGNPRLIQEYEKIKQKQKEFLIRLFGRLKQNMK